MNKRLLIIIAAIVVIIGALLVLLGRNTGQGPKSTTTINPTTGEKIVTDHGVTPEKAGTPTITIFGAQPIYDQMSDDQFNLFRDATNTYVRNLVSPNVTEVTIIPSSVKFDDKNNTLTATMTIDNPKKSIGIRIFLYQSSYINLTLSDPTNKTTPVYDTGRLPAPDTTDSGVDIEGDY